MTVWKIWLVVGQYYAGSNRDGDFEFESEKAAREYADDYYDQSSYTIVEFEKYEEE
jgi:hypothetical protein